MLSVSSQSIPFQYENAPNSKPENKYRIPSPSSGYRDRDWNTNGLEMLDIITYGLEPMGKLNSTIYMDFISKLCANKNNA